MKRIALAVTGTLIAGAALGATAVATTKAAPPRPATLAAAAFTPGSINLANCPELGVRYHGGCINELQDELNFVDNANLAVDGWFGPATLEAVMFFQAQHHLTPDGIVGQQTKDALFHAQS